MGLKIVIPIGYQRVKKISLTAMPLIPLSAPQRGGEERHVT
jgi:hypothetical protein